MALGLGMFKVWGGGSSLILSGFCNERVVMRFHEGSKKRCSGVESSYFRVKCSGLR